MVEIFLSILPIFLLIVLGNVLRRNGIPSIEFWNVTDKVVYWVLFPALLFYKTSTAEFGGDLAGPMATALLGGMAAAAAFSLAASKIFGFSAPVATTVLQGSARHNAFIALAIAERLYGTEGLFIAALATAILVPPTNLTIVGIMNVLLPSRSDRSLAYTLMRDLARNPLILSVLAGVAVNWADVGRVPLLHDTTELLGRAALPMVLLATGANIHFGGMRAAKLPLALAIVGKFLVFPAVAVGLVMALGLGGLPAYVITIFAAMPTASSTFTVARQLGGDAPLAAAVSAIQTLLSLVTVPVTLMIGRHLFSL